MKPLFRSGGGGVDPVAPRSGLRISHVRTLAVEWEGSLATIGAPLSEAFYFGRLAGFVDRASEQLPRLIARRTRTDVTVEGLRSGRFVAEAVHESLFDISGGDVLYLRTLDLAPLEDTGIIAVLEDLFYEQLTLAGTGSEEDAFSTAQDVLRSRGVDLATIPYSNEYHQLVLFPDQEEGFPWSRVQRIIYRLDMDAVEKYSDIRYPGELNRRSERGCALGPFVSVLWSQQDYIENLALLSSLMIVGASELVRGVRLDVHREMQGVERLFRTGLTSGQQIRTIENEVLRLQQAEGSFRTLLTFGGEAVATMMPMVPSLRAESYHRTLFVATGLEQQLALSWRMLEGLSRAVAVKGAALATLRTLRADASRRRWFAAAQFLVVVAAPLSLVLAFFSIQTTQVVPGTSMFDLTLYGGFYALFGAVGVAAALLFTLWWALDRFRIRRAIRDMSGTV